MVTCIFADNMREVRTVQVDGKTGKKTSSTKYEWDFKETQLKRYSVCSSFASFPSETRSGVARNVAALLFPHYPFDRDGRYAPLGIGTKLMYYSRSFCGGGNDDNNGPHVLMTVWISDRDHCNRNAEMRFVVA